MTTDSKLKERPENSKIFKTKLRDTAHTKKFKSMFKLKKRKKKKKKIFTLNT